MGAILIVDDDAELRHALRILLGKAAPIAEASDGPEALRKIASESPKLMLLDIAMPGMGGIAVLEAALEIDPSMTVLMLTGECDIEIAKGALEIGARAYITKPFDAPDLRREVERLISRIAGRGTPPPDRPWRVAW